MSALGIGETTFASDESSGSRAWLIAGATVAAIVAYICLRNYVLNSFIFEGDEDDTNIFARIVWRSGIRMENFIRIGAPGTFFKVHFTPFIYVYNLASYVLDVSHEHWFAFFIGSIHAALAAVFYALLVQAFGRESWY